MPATGYHFHAQVISRKSGQSAIAAVAYRAGDRFHDDRTGALKDYSRKRGVEFVFHAAPKAAPEWAKDIETAWNMKELAEDKSTCRATAQLARDYNMTFPHQLTDEQREWMLKDFVREEFTRKNLLSTAVIHAPPSHGDQRNYHAHVMVCDRTMDADGFSKTKDRHWTTRAEQKAYEAEALERMKAKWAELGARQLERAGLALEAERWRHGHKSLEEQRAAALARGDLEFAKECEREATIHLGPHVAAMERKGIRTGRGDQNRVVAERNRALAVARAALVETAREIALEQARAWEPEKSRLPGRFKKADPREADLDERKRAARLAATLYDEGGMASQQRDALRDHAERQRRAEQKWREQKTLQAERQPEPEQSVPEIDPEAAKAKALVLAAAIREGSGTGPRTHAVEKTLQRSADAGRPLDTEQAAALRHATENGFAILQGRAGTGKSFTLNAIRETYEREGFEIIGLAPTHAAAHELREAGFAEARTLHSFLYAEQRRVEQGRPGPEPGSRVLIVDEAGMVSDRHLIAIMETAAAHGARVVLAGDDRQLKSIEQGGLFGALAADRAAELTTVYRQRDDWQKTATRAFAQGDTAAGLEAYHERGFIHYADGDRAQAAAELVEQWVSDRDGGRAGTRFVFSVTNADTHAINALIQAEQIKAGLVTNTHAYTVADGREICIGEGDRVQFRGNDKANGIFNGALATVERIDAEAPHRLNVRLDNGEAKTIDTTDYRDIQLGYAGTVYRGQGKTLDRSYVLFSPYMDGRAAYVAATRAREETHIYAATADLEARPYCGHIRAEGVVMPETDFEKLIAVIESRAVYNERRPQQQRKREEEARANQSRREEERRKHDSGAAVETQRQDQETTENRQRRPEKPARARKRASERERRRSPRSRDRGGGPGRGGGGRGRER
jgi:ATP-dependent exoDNAse (exonuclease V) alpha subunit